MLKKHLNYPIHTTTSLNPSDIKSWLPKRPIDSHKGCFGHVVVIAGDEGMPGAARLAAEGALRVGAGLVSVITLSHHLSIVMSNRPELMCYAGETLHSSLLELLQKASIIVIGPGLGSSDFSKQWFQQVMQLHTPLLIDAGALTLLAQQPVSQITTPWILTPHPGEAARLLNVSAQSIQKDRKKSIQTLHQKYPHATLVLKGHHTQVLKYPDHYICTQGNPGMATPGMGDVLSGIIAGLFAQGLTPWQAASAGVFFHACAADHLYQKQGERGLLASDLFFELLKVINDDPGSDCLRRA